VQDEGLEQRAAAVESLMRAALMRLANDEGSAQVGKQPDNQHWSRYGQESFVGLRPHVWLMPPYVPIMGWLDRFPEMAAVRDAFAADPLLGPRVDGPLGTVTSRSRCNFDWLLIQHVLEPLVL
jgi:hypothetical protein